MILTHRRRFVSALAYIPMLLALLLISLLALPLSAAQATAPTAPVPATISGPETVEPGADIVVSGTGWTNAAGDAGSVIGVLIDARASGDPNTVYTTRDVVNPAAGDNAAMESFFSLLQKNVLDRKVWETRLELRLAIVAWIEGKYHRRRRQRGLGKLTPIEFEVVNVGSVALAA